MKKLRSRIARPSFVPVAMMLMVAGSVHSEEMRPSASLPDWPITLGTRVRLQAPAAVRGTIEGTVVELGDQSLVVRAADQLPVRVPHRAIERLEVSTGRRSKWLQGTVIGAVVGGAAGSYCTDCSVLEARAVGALGGAVTGLLIGAMFHGDRWSTVPMDGVRVSVMPARERGVGLSLSVAW